MSPYIDLPSRRPRSGIGVREREPILETSGIIDKNIETTKRLLCLREDGDNIFLIGNIQRALEDFGSRVTSFCCLLENRFLDRVEGRASTYSNGRGACLGKRNRARTTNTPGSSGDENSSILLFFAIGSGDQGISVVVYCGGVSSPCYHTNSYSATPTGYREEYQLVQEKKSEVSFGEE
ncbi:hypothetical protein BELL_0727g00030 [Botrytis elliptica]|uniref:Uncharacterized protein n=1 Tax=Botrytis elliptica TaxID=278938 RepID=A0A4Z1J9V2_9HELO|nr:hypothetical protein BELL_0727g00030 [Botrytis elliptica]